MTDLADYLRDYNWREPGDPLECRHRTHGFHYLCGICQGDVDAIAHAVNRYFLGHGGEVPF